MAWAEDQCAATASVPIKATNAARIDPSAKSQRHGDGEHDHGGDHHPDMQPNGSVSKSRTP